ncbi:monocarboxylate transporter 13-like [Asterias amurensis]|uniref:monocarboxylate transporter 13-like n=1 Tax=Asterias amurensis TaxID=7602 RepID=UPI003AB49D32
MAKYSADSEIHHWPILLASCITTSLTHGTASSMGVFYIEWYTEFPESSALVGWLSSSMLAMLLCFSPFAGAMTRYFGVRPIVFSGCLLSCAGLLISSFAQQFHILFITIPFMTGIGFGMSYSGAIISVSERFHKHYALANGICMTGASIGMVILPIVYRFLIDMYSWKGAIMISSAIQCHVIVCAMFMKEPGKQKQKPVSRTIATSSSGEEGYSQLPGDENRNMHPGNVACSSTTSQAKPMEDCKLTKQHEDKEIEVVSQGRCGRRLTSFLNHTGISLLWTNRVFSLFMLVILTNSPTFGITLPYLAAQAESVGISEVNASLLISILGLASILSRLTHGRLIDAHVIQPAYIYAFFMLLAATGAPILAAIDNFAGMVICTVLIGVSTGGYIPLQATIIRMIVGKDRFPGAFGMGLVVVAIGNMSSAYIGGYMFDVTNSYSMSFYFVGIVAGIAIFLVLGIHLLWTKLVKDDRWPRINKPTPTQVSVE